MNDKYYTAIWSEDLDGAIGIGNRLAYRHAKDMQWFRSQTLHHDVIMGRNTFEYIGKFLPGRRNFVISRSTNVVNELPSSGFVIGGAETFRTLLPDTHRLCRTVFKTHLDQTAYVGERLVLSPFTYDVLANFELDRVEYEDEDLSITTWNRILSS